MINNKYIKKRDFVIVGQQPWDVEIGSNCKNIALEFSKHNRVLYVNSPLDRITLLRHKNDPKIQIRKNIVHKKQEGIINIGENIWICYPDRMIESINWIKCPGIFNILNKRNNKIFAGSIKRALNKLEFSNIILFNDNDIFRCFYLKELLKPTLSIYYSRDYLLTVDYWKTHGKRLEPEIIKKSDCCVANSTYLADYCRTYNENSYYVGQGCDLDIFDPDKNIDKPADIKELPGPVIGYVGALQTLRLDLDILAYIASNKPEWNIVLVGPEDDGFKKSELHNLRNIYFVGSKPLSELPAYVNAFDVCLNPQVLNQVTIGNYPRKIDEYLAMGKPVVATRTRAMDVFKDYTYLGESKEDYIALITKALNEDSKQEQQRRRQFATSHTWENSVNKIYGVIDICFNKYM